MPKIRIEDCSSPIKTLGGAMRVGFYGESVDLPLHLTLFLASQTKILLSQLVVSNPVRFHRETFRVVKGRKELIRLPAGVKITS